MTVAKKQNFQRGLLMSKGEITTVPERLPVSAPDLVVEETNGGWQVLSVSAGLAEQFDSTVDALRFRYLGRSFADSEPPLAELAADAAAGRGPLRQVRVRFPGKRRETLMAEAVAGPVEDFSRKRVYFHFRPLAEAEQGQVVLRHGMVGSGPAMREVFRKIDLYAPVEAAVVITGETGTGKELAARALHDGSQRRDGPYVAVNCSAISEELLESELFGHEKGAFTGALRTHRGRFERADGGTLFLDEIGDMPFHTQTRLLRILEQGVVERLGSEQGRRVDVRVVAATNVPLEEAVGLGRFRSDLYHRLSVLRIHLPALRDRIEDIPALVDYFLTCFRRKYGRTIRRLTPEAVALLQAYLWPGNVRELRNVLERVFIETRSEAIGARAFREWISERQRFAGDTWERPAEGRSSRPAMMLPWSDAGIESNAQPSASRIYEAEFAAETRPSRRSTRPAELTIDSIRRAYRTAGGNLTTAARLLGVHRATLYRHLDKLRISRDDLAE